MIKNTVILLIVAVLGYSLGRYVLPARVETKTVTVIQKVDVIQHNTVTTVTEKPDGSKVTVITDKSKETDSTNSTSKSDIVTDNRAQWKLAVQLSPKNPQLYYFYGVTAERRILGSIFVGAFGNTDKQVGISLGLEF